MRKSRKISFKDRFKVVDFRLTKRKVNPIYCVAFFGPLAYTYLPKSLVELNSILLKITFGSYKFFGFFKRAIYNSMLNNGFILVS